MKPRLAFLDRIDREVNHSQLAADLRQQVVSARLLQIVLHNQNAWLIRTT
jgi:hypothetical protein